MKSFIFVLVALFSFFNISTSRRHFSVVVANKFVGVYTIIVGAGKSSAVARLLREKK